ncbi:hypothetical protein CVT25_000096 [Psilocybe cyanescens]|uniref:Uncharacterized protein n=1 Tax=Psilocybe cyanescens TaxID=93625 RepID=A0A409XKH7_PSICY|nr:hypothetical protein CVT25_000096 [Psilocybe cyanescens]
MLTVYAVWLIKVASLLSLPVRGTRNRTPEVGVKIEDTDGAKANGAQHMRCSCGVMQPSLTPSAMYVMVRAFVDDRIGAWRRRELGGCCIIVVSIAELRYRIPSLTRCKISRLTPNIDAYLPFKMPFKAMGAAVGVGCASLGIGMQIRGLGGQENGVCCRRREGPDDAKMSKQSHSSKKATHYAASSARPLERRTVYLDGLGSERRGEWMGKHSWRAGGGVTTSTVRRCGNNEGEHAVRMRATL